MDYIHSSRSAKIRKPFAGFIVFAYLIMIAGPFFSPTVALALSDTGYMSPTFASTNNGHNDWDTNAVANVQTSDNVYVSDNDEGDEQGYEDFGFSIPAGSTINGIEVVVEAKSSDAIGCKIETSLSWNNGSNFSSQKTAALSGGDAAYTLGGVADNWGHSWTGSQLSDANFVTRISFDDTSGSLCNSSTVSVDQLQAKVYYTAPVTNPTLENSCGLDIALVMDSSGSITNTDPDGGGPLLSELATMKSAFHDFVDAFLPATPTQFSVTDFDAAGDVNQTFTDDISLIDAAIDLPTSGGSTNWADGLSDAFGTFDPRGDHPNLVIFASDGNPTVPTNEATALASAIDVANDIKNSGTRIITIGIGSDANNNNVIDPNELNPENLKAISGEDAYYSSEFDTLALTLADLANDLCGGTINIKKLVDGVAAEGWTFDVNGSPSDPSPVETVSDGTAPSVPVEPGTYSVTEALEPGFYFDSAECKIGEATVGTPSENSVTGIAVGSSDFVSCVFNNNSNQPPIIEILGDNPLELVVNVGSYSEQGALADDAEDGQDIPFPTGNWTIDASAVNTGAIGFYSVFYNFTDSDGAAATEAIRTVNVVPGENECNNTLDDDDDGNIDFGSDSGCEGVDDPSENTPPDVIIDTEIIMLTLHSVFNPPTGVHAEDVEDVTVPVDVIDNPVNVDAVGDYTVTYGATDSDGASAEPETQTVKVRTECADTFNNDDEDDLIDANDPGCWSDPNDPETYNSEDEDETTPADLCSNIEGIQTEIPNGLISEEGQCVEPPPPTPACSDGVDNDEDGVKDFGDSVENDLGCSSPEDNDESDNPSATGHKWNDLDGDGNWDEGEPGIEGWTMALGLMGDAPIFSEEGPGTIPIEIVALTLTSTGGNYSLPIPSPGHYMILEESRNGWQVTNPDPNSHIDSFFDITYRIDFIDPPQLEIDSFFDIFVEIDFQQEGSMDFGNRNTQVTDVCPNLEGTQSEIPEGMVLEEGQCVEDSTPPTTPPPSPDLPECSDGLDNDGDGLVDIPNDPGCLASGDDDESSNPTDTGGGGGGGGGGNGDPSIGNTFGGGTVLGASSGPIGQVLGESTSCGEYLKEYIKLGKKNTPEEVSKLQQFLNEHLGLNLPLTGFYGSLTYAAVSQFQTQYGNEVLAPWLPFGHPNTSTPTGYVYKTTKRWINNLACSTLNLPIPPLP